MLSIFLPFFTFYAVRPSTMCHLSPLPPQPTRGEVSRECKRKNTKKSKKIFFKCHASHSHETQKRIDNINIFFWVLA